MSDVILIPQKNGPYYVKGKIMVVAEGSREVAVDMETRGSSAGAGGQRPNHSERTNTKSPLQNNLPEKIGTVTVD